MDDEKIINETTGDFHEDASEEITTNNEVNTSNAENLPTEDTNTVETTPDSEAASAVAQQATPDSGTSSASAQQATPDLGTNPASVQTTPDQYAHYANPNGYWNGNQPYGFIGYPPMGFQNGMPIQPVPPKKPSKVKKFFAATGLAVVFGLVAALVFIVTVQMYKKYFITPESNTTTTAQLHINDKDSETKLNLDPVVDTDKEISPTVISNSVSTESTDVSNVVDNVMPAIVSIDCTFKSNSIWGSYVSSGAGSGIILQKTDNELLIATNSHVINEALTIKVTFNNGKAFDATLKGKDQLADLAVIAIPLDSIDKETIKAIKVATLGNSDDIKVGQMAIAIGNSLGYGQSVTVGYISAKDREVTVDGKKMILLQTDAAINPGNSGGALLNINGEVIGINSVKYADSKVEGMGFAIPIARAFDILSELSTREVLADDEKGYLGVYIQDVAKNNVYNWPEGIYVSELVEGGAAEKAGILVGDIITAINGAAVTNTSELTERVQCYRYGTEITVTLQRMNAGVFEEKEIKVTLEQNTTYSEDKKSDKNASPEEDSKVPDGSVTPGPSDKLPDDSGNDSNNGNGYYYYDPFGSYDPFDPFSFFEW